MGSWLSQIIHIWNGIRTLPDNYGVESEIFQILNIWGVARTIPDSKHIRWGSGLFQMFNIWVGVSLLSRLFKIKVCINCHFFIQSLSIWGGVSAVPDIKHMGLGPGYSRYYTYVVWAGVFQIINTWGGFRAITDITPIYAEGSELFL